MASQDSCRSKNTRISRIILIFASILQLNLSTFSEARLPTSRRLPTQHVNYEVNPDVLPLDSTTHESEAIDYCALAATASKISQGIIPYKYAKGCYESFAFDTRIRDNTIQNVRSNLESFYVFYDISNSPPHMDNSDLNPVDLSAALGELAQLSFPNDYEFHQRLNNIIAELKDPHTTYRSMCYQQFVFTQPLSTYGVFENGRQRVMVATVLSQYDSRLDNDLVDCEVTHIDGQPAFDVISEFARSKPYSKDHGARINKVFSYLGHDKTGSPYDRYALGTFAQRSSVPSNPTVQYKIDCRSKLGRKRNGVSQTTLDLSWNALDASMAPFSDARSFRKQFCSDNSIQTTKKFVLDSASPDDFKSISTLGLSNRRKAKELYRGAYASFHLLSDGITGVMRLGTESPNKMYEDSPSFYANIDNGFNALESAGATKLIIDLQSNSGGIICWGRYVLQSLFPSTTDSPYIYSVRASPLAQTLAKATYKYNQDGTSPYEGLVDPRTGEEFDSDAWMVPGVALPGRDGLFSGKIADRYCSTVADIQSDDDEPPFDPKNIVILTNGYCGSTCAVLALQLHERYGIQTMAVGGEHGKSMMFTSFPGGAVQANNTLWVQKVRQVYSSLPNEKRYNQMETLLPKQLPANGQLAFTFRQVMSASQPNQVSEYMRIPSNYRMDYTVPRFRMPSILWEDVRDQVWGKSRPKGSTEESDVGFESDRESEVAGKADADEYSDYSSNMKKARLVVLNNEGFDYVEKLPEPDREVIQWEQRYENV
ncbi:hypothetical protein BGZ76_002828 [Entomortierella beljakovae]|nr:hypothetical protein BGZ76_002828 [Entomortierella beljakovae]